MPSPRVMACPITPRRQIAAAIRKKRHRVIVVAKIGVTDESAMLFGEDVVDAAVKLILAVRFYAVRV